MEIEGLGRAVSKVHRMQLWGLSGVGDKVLNPSIPPPPVYATAQGDRMVGSQRDQR